MAIGLYIHIPFCLKKCNYCDFISFPVNENKVKGYLDDLEQEMAFYSQWLPKKDWELETLYIGGGTPTCLSTEQLERLLDMSRHFFSWLSGIEVTIEANPGTLDYTKLKMLKNNGVNRLSLGAQSFSSKQLKQMGRQHRTQEIEEAVMMARQVGFDNLSLDLIYGLPEQTLEEWQETLARTFLLKPEHLSTYGLKIESDTPWGQLEAQGKIQPATEDLTRLMYDEVQYQCQIYGYQHYEISNFTKPGYEGRHNSSYWLTKPYLGLGVAAASFYANKRWTNVASLQDYHDLLVEGKRPLEVETALDKEDLMSEKLFLGLRLLEGVSCKEFKEIFGIELVDVYSEQIEKLSNLGLVKFENQYLRLTKLGLPIANEVFCAFI